jgi:hypothetical protein
VSYKPLEQDQIPTAKDLLDLHDYVKGIAMTMRANVTTQAGSSAGNWGATICLEDACYDLHGAMGHLWKQEGKPEL